MATSGEMIKIVADALQLPTATVTSYHRVLRQEGLVTKGGRGRSAAQMSAEDAAKLVITLLGSDCLEEAPAICRLLCEMCSGEGVTEDFETIEGFQSMGFLDAVVVVLKQLKVCASSKRRSTPRISIIGTVSTDVVLEVCASKLKARIIDRNAEIEFFLPGSNYPITYPDDWMSLQPTERLLARAQLGGLVITRAIDGIALRQISSVLR